MASRSKRNLGNVLEEALSKLHQIDHFNEYLEYLNSEWYFTTEDLHLATKDPKVWSTLKLPGRLKIELSSILNSPIALGESSPVRRPVRSESKQTYEEPQSDEWHPDPSQAEVPAAAEEDIKNGWVKCWSPEYECYYFYNTVSEESSWEDPLSADGQAHSYDVYQYSESEQKWVAVEEKSLTQDAEVSMFVVSEKSAAKSPLRNTHKSPDYKSNMEYKAPEGSSLTFTRPKGASAVSSSNNSASGSEDRLFVHSPNRPTLNSGRKSFTPDKPDHKAQYRYTTNNSNVNNAPVSDNANSSGHNAGSGERLVGARKGTASRTHKPIRLEMQALSSDESGSDANDNTGTHDKKRPSPSASKPLSRPSVGDHTPEKSLRSCPKKSVSVNSTLSSTGVHELDSEAKEAPKLRFRRHPSHMYDLDHKQQHNIQEQVQSDKGYAQQWGVNGHSDRFGQEEPYNFYKDYNNTDAEKIVTEPANGAYADADSAHYYRKSASSGEGYDCDYDHGQSSKTIYDPSQGSPVMVQKERVESEEKYGGDYNVDGEYEDCKESEHRNYDFNYEADAAEKAYGDYDYEYYDYYPDDQNPPEQEHWEQEANTEEEPDSAYNTEEYEPTDDGGTKDSDFDYAAYYNSYQPDKQHYPGSGSGVAAEAGIARSPQKAYEESLYHHNAEPSAPTLPADQYEIMQQQEDDNPERAGRNSQFRSSRAAGKQFTRHDPASYPRQDKSASPSVRAPADNSPVATPVRYDASLDDFLLVEASPADDIDLGDEDRGYLCEVDAEAQDSNYDLMSMALGSPGSNASPAVKQRKQLQQQKQSYTQAQNQQENQPPAQKSKKSKITKLFRLNLFGKGPSLPSTPPPPRDNSADADLSSSLNPHSSAYRQMKMEERKALRKGHGPSGKSSHSSSGSSLRVLDTGKSRDFPTQYARHSSEDLRNLGPFSKETSVTVGANLHSQENARNSPPNPHIRRKPRPAEPNSAQAMISQEKYLAAHAQRLPESQRHRIQQRTTYASKEEEMHYRSLQRLMDMGFDESESIMALSMCNDNLTEATQMLLDEHQR